jgi:hypothetical protein
METSQHEQYEYARRRIRQKKRLYFHFLHFGEPKEWYLWVITLWVFFFVLHFIKVFITDSFMNKNWERTQIDKLIEQQKRRIEQLHKNIDSDLDHKKS